MYILISGSPKPTNNNSMHFLKIISSHLENYKIFELKKDKYEAIIDNIKNSDVIVIAFPPEFDTSTFL